MQPRLARGLSSDQAAAIALKAMNGPSQSIKATDLLVTFDASGHQQLAWQIEVESAGPLYSSYGWYEINAIDGSIIDVAHG